MDANPKTPHPSSLTEATDPYCLAPGEERSLLAGAPWRRLVVMGDSVASGVGDAIDGYRDQSWADRLAGVLDTVTGRVDYVNLGVRGARARQIRVAQVGPARLFQPDLVVVSAGGNDMLSRRFDEAAVRAEIEEIIRPLRATGADVVTFGLFDISRAPFVPDEMRDGLRERIHRLGAVTEEVAEAHGCLHVDLLHHSAAGDGSIWSADLLHVNRRGHAIVAAEVIRSLSARLAAAPLKIGA
jgi:lysophospholipase L1-like esterase